MRAWVAAAALALAAGCPGGKAGTPAAGGGGSGGAPASAAQAAAFVEIATLEGKREGLERLRALAGDDEGDPAVRARAIRALARIGLAEDVARLSGWLADASVRTAAAEGLGLMGDPVAREATPALVTALAEAGSDEAFTVAVARALGRVGDGQAAGPALAARLAGGSDVVQEACALAIGTLGHRKEELPAAVLDAVVAVSGDDAGMVRYAAAYALFRAAKLDGVAKAQAVLETLAARDADAETRAIATRGLAQHGFIDAAGARLDDDDWTVRVQAVRALAGKGSTEAHHERLATWLADELTRMRAAPMRWAGPAAHVFLEAVDQLRAHAGEKAVAEQLIPLAEELKGEREKLVASGKIGGVLAASTAECWATAGGARGLLVFKGAGTLSASAKALAACGGDSAEAYPRHLRLGLVAELAGDKVVEKPAALKLLAPLAGDKDARVRAAAVGAAAALLPEPGAEAIVLAALGDADPGVVGTAAGALAERLAGDSPPKAAALLDEAARRLAGADPEIAMDLVGALCAAPDARFAPALRVAWTDPAAVVRAAARECLTKIEGKDPGEGAARAAAPGTPAIASSAVNQPSFSFHVVTTQGDFDLILFGAEAPWNVATFAMLAEKGFYDGTLWHRVVPDFVVQGGDPTGSGWGGPGYSVPAEASTRRYLRGVIGIADAGKDTGGSQWFVMHSRAPHLEQRYTVIGQVISGMDTVDRLHVGDKIVKITRTGPGAKSP